MGLAARRRSRSSNTSGCGGSASGGCRQRAVDEGEFGAQRLHPISLVGISGSCAEGLDPPPANGPRRDSLVQGSRRTVPTADARANVPAPVYRGSFGRAQAERLLWRAGFGPRPGEADRLARKGLDAAVESLINPGREQLAGQAAARPRKRLAPRDAWGHDHLWWLDRMVRTAGRSSSGWRSPGTTGSRPRTTASTRSG